MIIFIYAKYRLDHPDCTLTFQEFVTLWVAKQKMKAKKGGGE